MATPLHHGDPQQLGRYRLTGRLGQGGMGTVYLGQDEHNQQVAVKVINVTLASNSVFHQHFRREVEAARKVRPFCTAPILDASLDRHLLYVVTEYIPGPTLTEAVADSGPLRGADLAGLALGVATALADIHDAGIVHRDLKPSNVLLSGVGPRVIDFGLAKAHTQASATHDRIVGTLAYQAPEIMAGRLVTPASDVFSWGGLVAYASTGHAPFSGTSLSEVLFHVANDPPRLDGLDSSLYEIVAQSLSRDPAARPPVAEIVRRLTSGAGQSVASPPPPSPLSAPNGNEARHRPIPSVPPALSLFLAVCLLMIFVGGGYVVISLYRQNGTEGSKEGSLPGSTAFTNSPSSLPYSPSGKPTSSTAQTPDPVEDYGDVPSQFIGRWTGVITHHDTDEETFSALITITGGKLTQQIGQSEYSSAGCHGTLKLVSAAKSRLIVEEHIGRGGCKKIIIITLTHRKPQSLLYEYNQDSVHGEGGLSLA
ncbi:serine/threonine protein kinase [Actinomadura darangshiensis]|uniref:Serine/threonine protein kinase n=1 Tax=Actinomadura darangshiensis TaxID=705336 RepID=A0A4R5B5N5_9ACTN|nr:serine/threonine-protein kinase [Actinomadura darangshiensis]TDD81558.1 serine/threonine protein kinase [Actinomadura darangshiensis]